MAQTGVEKFLKVMSGSIGKIALVALVVNGLSLTYAASWTDYTAPIDDRVANLMTLLTTQQKISLRNKTSPSISGLAQPIVAIQWWTEMQNGRKTIFPASIGKVCTWDPDLMFTVGQVYGNEARNDYKSAGQQFYSPAMVNDALDPRDGRNDETWGEDPYLAGVLAGQLIRGAEGNHEYPMPGGTEYYMRISLMAKHLIGNNHENSRYNDIAVFDERDFYEWFLPPFKACVDADVGGIMTGLNPITLTGNSKVQDIENVVCPFTLDTILRKQWGWKGYTTSDCGGVSNAQQVPALEAGLDAECEDGLEASFDTNSVDKVALNQAISRLFRLRMRMGEFDPAAACPYKNPPAVDLNANNTIALQAAHEAVVLAKNVNNILPIDKTTIKNIVLIGPVAAHPASTNSGSEQNFFGGYSGWPNLPGQPICLQKALQTVASANGITLTYILGMDGTTIGSTVYPSCINSPSFTFSSSDQQKIAAAQIVIVAVGTENNDNRSGNNNQPCQLDDLYPGEGRDLTNINLPGAQEAMVKAVYGYNKKVVVVLQDQEIRSAPFIFDSCPGVVVSLTGGQEVGAGITDVLFGDFNPSGKMAQTWMRNISDYPAKADCTVRGKRTYWYFTGSIFFPFGHGLSYTTFAYSNIAAQQKPYNPAGPGTDTVAIISFNLQNSGTREGAEVAQLYIHAINSAIVRPIKELRNFKRLDLTAGTKSSIALGITKRDLAYWSTTNKAYTVDNGLYEIQIGSSSADIRLKDTISIPTTAILSNSMSNMDGRQAAQSGLGMKTVTMQRVFVDSRMGHYSFDAAYRYDIFTCNGRKVLQGKGPEVTDYLSHAARGIYLVMGQKKLPE
jgi:beta-glucosidase